MKLNREKETKVQRMNLNQPRVLVVKYTEIWEDYLVLYTTYTNVFHSLDIVILMIIIVISKTLEKSILYFFRTFDVNQACLVTGNFPIFWNWSRYSAIVHLRREVGFSF